MIVSFINSFQLLTHVTIGLFEVHNIAIVAMANQVEELLNTFGILVKVIAYVKDERSNLSTLLNALTSVISCSPFQLPCPFLGLYFRHAMSKLA
jgi:hypothetical protein